MQIIIPEIFKYFQGEISTCLVYGNINAVSLGFNFPIINMIIIFNTNKIAITCKK